MTINTNTKNPALRTTAPKNMKPVYCTDNGKRWPSAVACAEELGVNKINVWRACNGILKTCKKLHLCYEEDVAGVQTGMSNTLVSMSAENEALRAEVERLRAVEKIYNKKQQEENERNSEIARLTKLRKRHQNAYDNYMAHAESSLRCMEEIDSKLKILRAMFEEVEE
jgi:hypothetical protein